MDDDWRNGRHVVYRLHAHIVLIPKYRKMVMTDRVSNDIRASLVEVCERFDATLDAFETDADHAHLLVTYPPKVALSRLVMSMKTLSAMRVRSRRWPEVQRALWGEHFWSPSYAVVSCGGAPLDVVRAYVENQRSPNRNPGRPKKFAP
ncbi:MAG: IS200/IS605 family transposase [Acidimicrobiales bacterium]